MINVDTGPALCFENSHILNIEPLQSPLLNIKMD